MISKSILVLIMNYQRHYHTESERRQLDSVIHDSNVDGWGVSKLNRMKTRFNNLPDSSLVEAHFRDSQQFHMNIR